MICTLAQYCSGDKIEKNEIGAACSAYGVWRREAHCLEDLDVNERIILRWMFMKCHLGGMDWIDLAQDKCKWRVLVNAVMNLRVP
jgi:hypothetical protein